MIVERKGAFRLIDEVDNRLQRGVGKDFRNSLRLGLQSGGKISDTASTSFSAALTVVFTSSDIVFLKLITIIHLYFTLPCAVIKG
jgi:hypothetical protein